jgi:uroporphyrinogen-III synthase
MGCDCYHLHLLIHPSRLFAMRVIVTRPETDAQAWLDAIEQAGHEALYVPLIEIGPAPDAQAVVRAWHNWTRWQAVMFVSAQAVRMFFAQRPAQVLLEIKHASNEATDPSVGPRFWATGPGTRQALIDAGVTADCIDAPSADAAQFDSEALWQVVQPALKKQVPVLIVRGNEDSAETPASTAQHTSLHSVQHANPQGVGRDWLAQHIVEAGAHVEFVVAYARRPPQWSDRQFNIAKQAATDGSVWCFSSSQAVLHLQAQLPDAPWHQARCIATHARIAQTAREVGFVNVVQTRPVLSEVLASLESLA